MAQTKTKASGSSSASEPSSRPADAIKDPLEETPADAFMKNAFGKADDRKKEEAETEEEEGDERSLGQKITDGLKAQLGAQD